jgi:hypothetical protein
MNFERTVMKTTRGHAVGEGCWRMVPEMDLSWRCRPDRNDVDLVEGLDVAFQKRSGGRLLGRGLTGELDAFDTAFRRRVIPVDRCTGNSTGPSTWATSPTATAALAWKFLPAMSPGPST